MEVFRTARPRRTRGGHVAVLFTLVRSQSSVSGQDQARTISPYVPAMYFVEVSIPFKRIPWLNSLRFVLANTEELRRRAIINHQSLR